MFNCKYQGNIHFCAYRSSRGLGQLLFLPLGNLYKQSQNDEISRECLKL